jgi:hypothetical protein
VNEKNKLEYTNLQRLFLFIIPVAFIVLAWRMFPFSNIFKAMLCCFLGAFIILVAVVFAEYLGYFKRFKSAWAVICITAVVFLLFPAIINVVYGIHEKEYLNSYPTDNSISVKITYDIDRTGGSGSIGGEWTYKHFLNNQEFKNGDILKVNAKSPFTITSRFIERDSISDVGETTSPKYNYSSNDNYKKTLTILQKVHVVENGGRKYAGSTADFEATYTLKRVIPESMTFWDMFLCTTDDSEHSICIFLIIGQALSIAAILFVLIRGNTKKKLAEEREQTRKEQEFLADKTAFIMSLNGKSLRQAAGVPSHVSFVNGLPKDNNDAQYGSFTVYCSSSGSCYHDRIGCCSARRPVHYFNAKNRFRPCSKCCTRHRSVPQWYINYTALKKQAAHFKIDADE